MRKTVAITLAGHDASMCILDDYKINTFVQEERLNRKKHSSVLDDKLLDLLPDKIDDLILIKSSIKQEFFKKGKKVIDKVSDMKDIASNKLEDWLEEDEDINQNLDFKQKSFYNEDTTSRSFSDKKEDDPWI